MLSTIHTVVLSLKSDTETVSECPEGMVYQECGTACPTTCDNKDVLVRPCTLQCVQGKVIVDCRTFAMQ